MLRILCAAVASLALLGLVSAPSTAEAQTEFYEFTVRRIERNVYYDRLQRIVLMTTACSELAVLEAVQVIVRGRVGTMVFPSGTTCDVTGAARPNAYLRKLRDNVYVDDLRGYVVRTNLCLELTLGEDVLVTEDRVIFLESRAACPKAW